MAHFSNRFSISLTVTRPGWTCSEVVDQLAVVLSENLHRRGLTDAEVVKAVQQMIDLGESGAAISRRTGITKARTTRLARVARSTDQVLQAVADRSLTIDQALVLDEFKDDDEHLAALIDALDSRHPGDFDAKARRYRSEKKAAKEVAAAIADLTAQGIAAYDDDDENAPDLHTRMWELYESRDEEDQHQQCPHRAIVVRYLAYSGELLAAEACAQPESHPLYAQRQQALAEREERAAAKEDPEKAAAAKKA